MLRWFFLGLALSALVLGTLTVFRSPPWSSWQLAVLAGEYGHWFGLAMLAVATLSAMAGRWRASGAGAEMATAGVALVAAALLLKPVVQAWRVGAKLPGQLRAQFGPAPTEGESFAWGELFGRDPEAVPVETREVAAGLPMDFYRPVRGPANPRGAACVIVIHGGGWDSGDRTQIPKFNHWLARRGYAVAAISYRLAPKHLWPAQRQDVLSAIAYLKAYAGALGIDSSRLVLLGRSAGGQIAEVVAYSEKDSSIRGLIALYAPSDLYFGYVNTHENDILRSPALMRKFLGGPPEAVRANYETASALNFVSTQSPPTLLLHGDNDALVWNRHSVRLDARLAELGRPRVFVALPWATHAFDFNLHGPGGQLTRFSIEWFLAAVTK